MILSDTIMQEKMSRLESHIRGLIDSAYSLQLATEYNGQPWVCSVYFVADEKLNIYWLSLPERRHSQELAQNPKAAITMPIKTSLPVIGLGAEGSVAQVTDLETVKNIMELYVQKYKEGSLFYQKFLTSQNKHQMYKFTPSKFVLFDEENFSKDDSVDFIPDWL